MPRTKKKSTAARPTQTIPVTVYRTYREVLPSGKRGEVTWSTTPNYNQGMKPGTITKDTVRTGTSLWAILDAVAAALKRPAAQLSFRVYPCGARVAVESILYSWEVGPGKPVSARVDGLVSPLPWRKLDRHFLPWTNLPDGVDSSRPHTVEGLAQLFTAEQIAGPWLWKKADPETAAVKRMHLGMKITIALSDSDMTVAETAALLRRVQARRARRRKQAA